MKITRNNYEEYFLLYIDNELDNDACRALEAFLLLHPDLQEEMDLLRQTKLTIDVAAVYPNKEELILSPLNNDIASNTSVLLLYIDNELSTDQKNAVEVLIATEPQAQNELFVLQQTKLIHEPIIFPNKDLLYRKEEKDKSISWWRMAAAVLLIGGVGAAIVLTSKKKSLSDDVVSLIAIEAIVPQNENHAQHNNNNLTSVNDSSKKEKGLDHNPEKNDERPAQQKIYKVKKSLQSLPTISRSPESATEIIVQNEKKNLNNLPISEKNAELLVELSAKEKNNVEIIKNTQKNSGNAIVTIEPDNTYINTSAFAEVKQANKDIEYAVLNKTKKNKMRGFLRKLARNVEKRIGMEDDDDRILIAGFSISAN